jgi:hypothetical protein
MTRLNAIPNVVFCLLHSKDVLFPVFSTLSGWPTVSSYLRFAPVLTNDYARLEAELTGLGLIHRDSSPPTLYRFIHSHEKKYKRPQKKFPTSYSVAFKFKKAKPKLEKL